MNEMIFTYKSEIYIFIRSESNNEEITPNNNIYIDGEETLAEGVMLGLKSPRYLNEDGSFSGDKYRTLWISYKDNEVGTVYAKENIIFPRINGIWNIKVNEIEKNNKHYDERKILCICTYIRFFVLYLYSTEGLIYEH